MGYFYKRPGGLWKLRGIWRGSHFGISGLHSWGETWGEDGYVKIKMGTCGIEYGAGYGNFWMDIANLPSLPTAPSNLNAKLISENQVNLSWKDNSNNEDEFKIYRKSCPYWYYIAQVGPNVTTHWIESFGAGCFGVTK